MAESALLHQLLESAAANSPDRIAVVEAGGRSISYRELEEDAGRYAVFLTGIGVQPNDRVGLCTPKSIASVAAIFGILKAGGVYVPVDVNAPAARSAYIFSDCSVAGVFGPPPSLEKLDEAFEEESGGPFASGENLLNFLPLKGPKAEAPAPLAYILYTSGSTGKPKGVMISHQNALSFIDWASDTFDISPNDRFSSHAPFHFDLSIFDLYVSLKHGATLYLIGEDLGKNPVQLADFIESNRLTIWYSTPSILRLLSDFGKLEDRDLSSLRTVLFAGEVFPVKHLRRIKELVPQARCFNLYGPTETNVCTWLEIPETVPPEMEEPFPIGRACSNVGARVVDTDGADVARGEEGELWIRGEPVMQGYWNFPELSAKALVTDASGTRWHRTGDLVKETEDGIYDYLGRRDRMVKRRGYRVELGEIEAALYRHSAITEAAVVAIPDEESGVRIRAYLCSREEKPPSLIQLKPFCARHLPLYMIPDDFRFLDSLPKTSTDKIDYQQLLQRSP